MEKVLKKVISLSLCLVLVFSSTIYADEETIISDTSITNQELESSNEELVEEIKTVEIANEETELEENEEETELEETEIETTESEDTESEKNGKNEIDVEETELKDNEETVTSEDKSEKIESEKSIASSSEAEIIKETEEILAEDEIEEDRVLSFWPSEFKAPKVSVDKKSKLFGGDALPSSYDSRDYTNDYGVKIIPPVKNQGNYGTCWAFAMIGMFESSIIKKNYVTTEEAADLSEAAMAYFTLNNKNITNNPEYMDKPGLEGHDYTVAKESRGGFANCGSNYVEASLVASSHIGVVKEDGETAYSNMPNIIVNGLDGNYAFKRNAYNLGSVQFINKDNVELVKKAIMENGCVAIAYGENRNNSNCHEINGEWYYYHRGYDSNHGVLIVGWDDNIPKENFYYFPGSCAPHNGGWLIKNSWGTESPRMNQGYFWMSYDDPSIDYTFATIDAIKSDTYKYNYHYDTTGLEVLCWFENVSKKNGKLGNVFKVSDNEDQTLDAISFALASTNAKYGIEIYTSDTPMANPSDGIKRLSQIDTRVSSGIYTVKLDNPVSLKKGTYFSIVILPISADYDRFKVFFDKTVFDDSREYLNESALGQGFEDESAGAGWTDFNITTGELVEFEGVTCGYNLRIKGLTNPANKINFVANNGTGETSYQAVKFGTETVLEKHPFTKEGYNFARWKDENGNTYDDEATVIFNDELTLTAEWEPITYNIIYNANNGTIAHESIVKTYNSNITLDVPTKEYSNFVNWYLEPTFENVYDGASDISTTQGENVNIYAKWQGEIFTVNFEAYDGHINTGEFAEYEYGLEKTLPTDVSPSDDDKAQNKLFYGWYDNEEFTGNKITKIEITDHGTKNYFARYVATYTITYESNGGSGYMPVQVAFACDSTTLRRNSFTRSGYSFKNWSTSNGSIYNDGQSLGQLSGNLVLNANWNKDKSSGGGGTGGGGGGGGGGLPTQKLPNEQVTETVVSIDTKNAPVISDPNNASWTTDANGNWHLQIIDANGQVVEAKDSWVVMNTIVYDALGQLSIVSDKFFFDENGKMLTGWLTDSLGNKYFLDNSNTSNMGKMTIGWKQVADSWYYFNIDGTMLSNGVTPDGFTIGTDGKWLS